MMNRDIVWWARVRSSLGYRGQWRLAQRLLEWASRRDVAAFYEAIGQEHQSVHLASPAD